MNPKFAPAEAQRQKRLIELDRWGRAHLTAADLSDSHAVQMLSEQAVRMFGVSTYTANNYAKVVFWKLSKETVKVDDIR